MKKQDPRLRKALLSCEVDHKIRHDGFEAFTNELIFASGNLVTAISDRSITKGMAGHQKNYIICRRIAALRIKLDEAMMVWSGDNIATFERSMMSEIEHDVRLRRSKRPPRRTWPHCNKCGGLVDVMRHLYRSDGDNYTCFKCID